jgi:hypothetical protein
MENLYQAALKALVDSESFYPYQNEILMSPSSLLFWNYLQTNFIHSRKIIFINSDNESIIQNQNDNVIEILELEPPNINHDTVMIKINHMLCAKFDLPIVDYTNKRLTDTDKTHIDYLLKQAESSERFKDLKIFSPMINCKWTYVTFKFDCTERRFKYHDIETKITIL